MPFNAIPMYAKSDFNSTKLIHRSKYYIFLLKNWVWVRSPRISLLTIVSKIKFIVNIIKPVVVY